MDRYLYGSSHHINHASCGYHLSPFDEKLTTVVIDGWGWVGAARDFYLKHYMVIVMVL